MALGALAAGAAHEIGTPLSTIATLARELEREAAPPSEELRLIREQVERCKKIVTDLLASAGQSRLEACGRESVDRFLAAVLDDWRRMRPGHPIQWRWHGAAPRIVNEPALKQTLLSLLNNAADVSEAIEVEAFADNGFLIVEVRDRMNIDPNSTARCGACAWSCRRAKRGSRRARPD
jgi:two-component system sensor histidine kinase RegB